LCASNAEDLPAKSDSFIIAPGQWHLVSLPKMPIRQRIHFVRGYLDQIYELGVDHLIGKIKPLIPETSQL